MFEKEYGEFKKSACYNCGYCDEHKRSAINVEEWLDVRDSGVVKVFCHAVHAPVGLQNGAREDCSYRKKTHCDGLYCAP